MNVRENAQEPCNTKYFHATDVYWEKLQYSGPKFMTIFSEPRCLACDVKCLKSMYDVTNKGRRISFHGKTLLYLLFSQGLLPPNPPLQYTNIIVIVCQHKMCPKIVIFFNISWTPFMGINLGPLYCTKPHSDRERL